MKRLAVTRVATMTWFPNIINYHFIYFLADYASSLGTGL